MATRSSCEGRDASVLATVAALVTVADGDTLYRDVYLRRATELLRPIVSESAYEGALQRRDQLTRLFAQARAAVIREDWATVREIGTRADALKTSLDGEKEALAVAASVYGAPAVVLDPLSPGLGSFSQRWPSAAQARTELRAALTDLGARDAVARDLYRARERAIAAVAVPEAAASASGVTGRAADRSQSALDAIERADAAGLRALAESMSGGPSTAAAPGAGGTATGRATIQVPAVLSEPLPDACRTRAVGLGLEVVEVTLAPAGVVAAVNDFLAEYALSPSAARFDRAGDGVARLNLAAGEVDVPREVAELFAETLSLFALHFYVNCAGIRYVPVPTSREPLLVETHGEGDEGRTALLRELGLSQRRGLARSTIEAALHREGVRVLGDLLGLDPHSFRLVCIPPDLYVRIGRDRGWGVRDGWTHFDGYQVMSGGQLRALVGGNARYGGLADLCSLSVDDGRENTVVRFAVVRRERLGVRIG